MVTGTMHTGTVVHGGRVAKKTAEYTLYVPICASLARQAIAYLGIVNREITCTRCLNKIAKHPHLFRK